MQPSVACALDVLVPSMSLLVDPCGSGIPRETLCSARNGTLAKRVRISAWWTPFWTISASFESWDCQRAFQRHQDRPERRSPRRDTNVFFQTKTTHLTRNKSLKNVTSRGIQISQECIPRVPRERNRIPKKTSRQLPCVHVAIHVKTRWNAKVNNCELV